LLDEWERLLHPETAPERVQPQPAAPGEVDVTRDEKAFLVLVRNALYKLLGTLARKDWAAAAAMVSAGGDQPGWTQEAFASGMAPFFAEHTGVRLDPSARSPGNTRVTRQQEQGTWDVVQVVSDAEGDDDWALSLWVDLAASAREAKPVMVMREIGR
jgi:hypothetical protein